MAHIALLGDSIFDNRPYVPAGTEVVAQLQERLGARHQASLLARDGSVLADVQGQLNDLHRLREAPTLLVLSCGGNDALGLVGALQAPVRTVLEATDLFAQWQAGFRSDYRAMLDPILALGIPLVVSTVYDAVPGLSAGLRSALSLFNDVILSEAIARGIPVLDLRLVCPEPGDYSTVSPIEPSAQGGGKIAAALAELLTGSGADLRRTVVHPGSRG